MTSNRPGLSASRDTTFIKNGFSDWFHALENKRGLWGHDDSLVHKNAYAMWQERKERLEKNETITTLVCDSNWSAIANSLLCQIHCRSCAVPCHKLLVLPR